MSSSKRYLRAVELVVVVVVVLPSPDPAFAPLDGFNLDPKRSRPRGFKVEVDGVTVADFDWVVERVGGESIGVVVTALSEPTNPIVLGWYSSPLLNPREWGVMVCACEDLEPSDMVSDEVRFSLESVVVLSLACLSVVLSVANVVTNCGLILLKSFESIWTWDRSSVVRTAGVTAGVKSGLCGVDGVGCETSLFTTNPRNFS